MDFVSFSQTNFTLIDAKTNLKSNFSLRSNSWSSRWAEGKSCYSSRLGYECKLNKIAKGARWKMLSIEAGSSVCSTVQQILQLTGSPSVCHQLNMLLVLQLAGADCLWLILIASSDFTKRFNFEIGYFALCMLVTDRQRGRETERGQVGASEVFGCGYFTFGADCCASDAFYNNILLAGHNPFTSTSNALFLCCCCCCSGSCSWVNIKYT